VPRDPALALNAIAPYFTMFPLDFPLRILEQHSRPGDAVLDPFCGRGTTSFAARVHGLESVGVDANPVAAAITAAKLVDVEPAAIVAEAARLMASEPAVDVPSSEFWLLAYEAAVLEALCRIREGLITSCETPVRVALRGIVLGALHGPRNVRTPSYFSNQAPRTYAPKPAYAVRFWNGRGLRPEAVDVLSIIQTRAERYFTHTPSARGGMVLGDSRNASTLESARQQLKGDDGGFSWIITSPPYYGMRTYGPDQWLRSWFLGGPPTVAYRCADQLSHRAPKAFGSDLSVVWRNVASVARSGAQLVVRFGAIRDRDVDPRDLIVETIEMSPWRIQRCSTAGSAHRGKRQADAFLRQRSTAVEELDVWCTLT